MMTKKGQRKRANKIMAILDFRLKGNDKKKIVDLFQNYRPLIKYKKGMRFNGKGVVKEMKEEDSYNKIIK